MMPHVNGALSGKLPALQQPNVPIRDSECLDCRCLHASPLLPRNAVVVSGADVQRCGVRVWHVDLNSAVDRHWHCKDEQYTVVIGISRDV